MGGRGSRLGEVVVVCGVWRWFAFAYVRRLWILELLLVLRWGVEGCGCACRVRRRVEMNESVED